MSLQEIINQIKNDAEKKANEIIENARIAVENIKSDTKNEVKKINEEYESRIYNETNALKEELEKEIEAKRKGLLLSKKKELLDKAVTEIRESLIKAIESNIGLFIDKAIKEMKSLGYSDEDIIILSKKKLDLDYKIEKSNTYAVKSKDNKVVIDLTPEKILKENENLIRVKLLEAMSL